MTPGWAAALLLAAGAGLLALPDRRWTVRVRGRGDARSGPVRNPVPGTGARSRMLPGGRSDSGQEGSSAGLQGVVQQLAAMLRAGRGQTELWADAARASAACAAPDGTTAMLAAAADAARGGQSVPQTLRRHARALPAGAGAPQWLCLAACLETAERSGAPLAGILARYAAQLEAESDAEALRATALAGPRATVRILTWLPVLGLGLATALGLDPVGVLLGGPVGWAALTSGLLLMGAARWWSRALLRSAVSAGNGKDN